MECRWQDFKKILLFSGGCSFHFIDPDGDALAVQLESLSRI
jgi:hypothetical protein